MRSNDAAVAFQKWWPLLGTNHPNAKATVLFCVMRFQAEVAAKSLRKAALSRQRKRVLSCRGSASEPCRVAAAQGTAPTSEQDTGPTGEGETTHPQECILTLNLAY